MKKFNRKKTSLSYRLSFVLLCAVIASFYMIGGLHARYFTSGKPSDDGARVASFNISALTESNAEKLDLDLSVAQDVESKFYGFTVHNDSEVKVACTVTVTLEQKLPIGVEIAMKLGEDIIELTKVSDTEYACNAMLDFQEKHEYTLIFTGNPATVTENTALNVSIDVAAEQID